MTTPLYIINAGGVHERGVANRYKKMGEDSWGNQPVNMALFLRNLRLGNTQVDQKGTSRPFHGRTFVL